MSINFLKEQNIKMLWDVVSDEDIFRFLTPDNQSKIYQLFLNNIEGFSENEGTKTISLVNLNKKYILLILNHIKKTYSPSKIKIHNEQQQPLKELITFEEIQNDRKSQFEQDFNRIQEEFEDSISIKPPPVPEFTDPKGKTDEPIKEMDKILKEMQSQRKYEVEQINRSYNTSNNIDNWLKPQETSLKTEKYENKKQELQTNNRFKYLNELDQNLTPKKNVTFNNNDQVNTFISEVEVEDDEDINIFAKLKKVNKKEGNIRLEIDEINTKDTNLNEDRIAKLERNVLNLTQKIDKILALLSQTN
jgi:hypothetical protein